ncbi:hypothetical protein Drose_15825 [Dactylosporangium roseum]|uniref:Uncharacterized protein n=1 Tax=Dactylosporangium roseum TaxID=47989 RepID=A0ABY5ZBX8_9ACTN|nr:hypothetical protein [Dactylosporangium roseum]UWZ39564.1 hypothetical protein Drose_15825 [Dactylosporangium roseum]
MMEVDELREALVLDDADPGAVLARLSAKRRARHHRRQGFAAAGTVVVLAAGGLFFARAQDDAQPPSAAPATASIASGGPSAPAVAEGCVAVPLADRLRDLRGTGASVIVARAHLTGRTASDGVRHHEMTLDIVRTLGGPAVHDGARVWVETPELPPLPDPVARGNPGPLWGPGEMVFALVLPQQLTGSALGVTVEQAPIVDGKVIFGRSGGCWSTSGLSGTAFHGRLTEIPGSETFARASTTGFTAVPLSSVERLASGL